MDRLLASANFQGRRPAHRPPIPPFVKRRSGGGSGGTGFQPVQPARTRVSALSLPAPSSRRGDPPGRPVFRVSSFLWTGFSHPLISRTGVPPQSLFLVPISGFLFSLLTSQPNDGDSVSDSSSFLDCFNLALNSRSFFGAIYTYSIIARKKSSMAKACRGLTNSFMPWAAMFPRSLNLSVASTRTGGISPLSARSFSRI